MWLSCLDAAWWGRFRAAGTDASVDNHDGRDVVEERRAETTASAGVSQRG